MRVTQIVNVYRKCMFFPLALRRRCGFDSDHSTPAVLIIYHLGFLLVIFLFIHVIHSPADRIDCNMMKDPRVVCGEPAQYVPSHINYGKYVLDRLQLGEHKEALISGETGEMITYKDLVQRIVNLAVGLKGLGVQKGDVVLLLSENRIDYIVSIVGSICCGAVVSTANVTYTQHELIHNFNISKPKFVFCSPFALKNHYNTILSLSYVKTIIRYGGEASMPGVAYEELIKQHVDVASFEPVDVTGQVDTATILCSSGTTGLPKGVMLTHLNLLISAVQMTDSSFIERGLLSFLTIVPWHHAYGYMSTINLLCNHVRMVYLQRFEPQLYLESIQKYKINTLLAVPPLVVFLAKSPLVLKYDLSSVREIWCGAAPLQIDIIEATKKRFPSMRSINQAYGMTETSLAATRDQMVMDGSKAGSGGTPVPGVKIKVVDLETRKTLGAYEKGEICIKGPIIMKGYIGDGVSTSDAFDQEGYLKSGDIGYYDNDGYFFIVDRVKELVKYKGFQVAPAEVEAVLLQHPGVAECGVVGRPDEVAGELPTAFVVKQPGVNVTEKELIQHVANKLSTAKHLHGGVTFVDEIPKNISGKILRRALKEKYFKPASKL